MKWMVAPSYQNATIKNIDEAAHKVYIEQTCDRCGGKGYYAIGMHNNRPVLSPHDGGVCWECSGSGIIGKWVKGYTEKEYQRYIDKQERQKALKKAKEEAQKKVDMDNSLINMKNKLTELGYDAENPLIWLVGGGNTYAIKDQLKEQGCKFNTAFGWYNNHEFEVPVGYGLISINFHDAYNWFPRTKKFDLKDDAKAIADAAKARLEPESHSEYIGEEKERLHDLEVTVTSVHSCDGFYGTTFIYTFNQKENVLVWMTSSCKDIEVGDELFLTGTVKKHSEYKGTKQTMLSRCIIKAKENM